MGKKEPSNKERPWINDNEIAEFIESGILI